MFANCLISLCLYGSNDAIMAPVANTRISSGFASAIF